MSIKIALLKSGELLLSDIKELVANDKACGYLFKEPHRVSIRTPILLTEDENTPEGKSGVEVILSPWIVLTSDSEMAVPLEWVVTLVEPLASVKKMYFDKLQKYQTEEKVKINV